MRIGQVSGGATEPCGSAIAKAKADRGKVATEPRGSSVGRSVGKVESGRDAKGRGELKEVRYTQHSVFLVFFCGKK